MPTPEPPAADPFGTAELRAAVLASWRRSPARFREDANAEESLALIGYAGRVVVELAANAADAAIEAGVPGCLRFSVVGDELRVANTGAPLTAAGVAALSSLRASAKRTSDVPDERTQVGTGQFGVGFTAVLEVTERPAVVSTAGAVQFSSSATIAAIAAEGAADLDAEVAARAGHVPVLRLPWPLSGEQPPSGFATEVRLPLRAGLTAAHVLAAVGDHLLLALPALERIELPDRQLVRLSSSATLAVISDNDVSTTWRLASRTGELSSELLSALPTEQRRRTHWRVLWAYPEGRALGPDVLYSPTPTDEPLSLPARLIGSFPVDDSRRHIAAGTIADRLLAESVEVYIELMADTPPAERLRLLPSQDFGRGQLDTRLRHAIVGAVHRTPLLVSAAGDAVRPDDARVLPGASDRLIELAAQAIPGLLPSPRDSYERDALRGLGVRVVGYAELSSALGGVQRPPEFWGELYSLLEPQDPKDLADLPVPLVSGRTVLGGRGCLLADPADEADQAWWQGLAEEVPALRVVHPGAVGIPGARHLLERIGAREADGTTLLADPMTLSAVAQLRADLDDDDVSPSRVSAVATAVLDVIAAGGEPGEQLRADLLLTDDTGEPWPAAELLLPDAPLARVLSEDADLPTVGAEWLRYGTAVLRSAGVLFGFRRVLDADAHGPDHDLPDEAEYWDEMGDRLPEAEFVALADLDLIADDQWPDALELIRSDPDARAALRPVAGVPSYSGWWLSRYALIEGHPPSHWRLPGSTELRGLFDPLPVSLDDDFARSIGVRGSLAEVLKDAPDDLVSRFTDPARRIPAGRVPAITAALVAAIAPSGPDQLPAGVRSLAGSVVDAERAMVVDLPWLAGIVPAAVAVPGGGDPAGVARFFDIDLASDRLAARVVGRGSGVDETVRTRLRAVGEDLGIADLDLLVDRTSVVEMLSVHVDGTAEGLVRRVSWWVDGDRYWVDGSAAGWGRLLAQHSGDWSARHRVSARVADDEAAVVEDGLDKVAARPAPGLESSGYPGSGYGSTGRPIGAGPATVRSEHTSPAGRSATYVPPWSG